MIHHDLLTTIRKERGNWPFIQPYYERLSIAEFGPTVLDALGAPNGRALLHPSIRAHPAFAKDILVFFLVDGLGYDHFITHYKKVQFLRDLAERGDVYPLTSVFPSTTSAALTAIHTGITPQEHGIPEWNVYFEEYDSLVQSIPFKTWEMERTDQLLEVGADPSLLYEGPTTYGQLREAGVTPVLFIDERYASSVYSRQVHAGADIVPFTGGEDLMESVLNRLESQEGKAYYFVYWGQVDGTAHHHGPGSAAHIASIEYIAATIQERLLKRIRPEAARKAGLLLSADHGHVSIKGEDIINLNEYPLLEESFLKSKAGKKILPTGSPHDVFLFIEPAKLEAVARFLKEELVGKAEVLTSEEGVQRGLFGINHPSAKFLRRIGNLLVIPYPGYHVWYKFFPEETFSMLGIHGGLSEAEMIVPFAAAEMEALLNLPGTQ